LKAVEILFATVLRVVDGDTLSVDINQCNIDFFCKKVEVRLAGFDTAEMKGKCPLEKDLAKKAKLMVEAAYPKGSTVVLSNPKRDKYGRVLAEQPIIAKKLLDAGLAIPYDGGKKTHDWCVKK
jgi:micrococcal nuclease